VLVIEATMSRSIRPTGAVLDSWYGYRAARSRSAWLTTPVELP
jgi:hypothetical protein